MGRIPKFFRILMIVILFLITGCRHAASDDILIMKNGLQTKEESVAAVSAGEETQDVVETKNENEQICIYICGEVNKPGVYLFEREARVYEAVDLAGGMSEAADPDSINLADHMEDGEKIYIPSVEEVQALEKQAADDGLLNLNTASKADFETLPGIGPGKAAAILVYREQNGSFSDISDILKVPGIGQGIYSRIEGMIKVD